MANTQIADIYEPLTFAGRAQIAQVELNAFIASGVAVRDPLLEQQFAMGGRTGELPQFNGITIDEPNYSNDAPGDVAATAKIASVKQLVRSAARNKHWSTMDMAREVALQDPVGAITGRIGAYWAADDQTRVINSLVGVLADNVANDSGDMLYDIATDAVGAVTDAERISSEAVAIAVQTMGDRKAGLTAIAMHSVTESRLARQNLIKEHRDNDSGRLMFTTYLGMRVVIDDTLPAVAGTNRITYTSIMFGAGSIGWGNGPVNKPSAMTREELKGNGGGEDIISSRVNTIYHPYGLSFLSASVAGASATYAELATATNWNRIVPRKLVQVAYLQTND